mmetsp:Transcript_90316/g.271327  ORF Transcript_90316/g.271327 Transcript_90316/m.271327 type:complete len:172 (-) Transcript_90316:74-589(-)
MLEQWCDYVQVAISACGTFGVMLAAWSFYKIEVRNVRRAIDAQDTKALLDQRRNSPAWTPSSRARGGSAPSIVPALQPLLPAVRSTNPNSSLSPLGSGELISLPDPAATSTVDSEASAILNNARANANPPHGAALEPLLLPRNAGRSAAAPPPSSAPEQGANAAVGAPAAT